MEIINKSVVDLGNQQDEITAQEKRTHHRHQISTPEHFVVQREWGNFIQIYLYSGHLIIGEILDISLGGLSCRVAYQFDLVDPIDIDIVIAIKGDKSEANCFMPVQIPSMLMRSKPLESSDTCELGIQFKVENAYIESKITQLIDKIGKK